MRIQKIFFYAACFTVVLTGCDGLRRSELNNLPGLSVVKTIVPSMGEKSPGESGLTSEERDIAYQAAMVPRIQIKPDDVLLQVINTNLDIDPTDEQILLVKKRDDTEAAIRIVIADFDTVRNIYRPTWEGETQAINMRGFSLTLEDLVGDHSLQLVCIGLDKDREQTIDVFRKTQGPGGLGLYYESILSLKSNGSIEIARQERSQAYNLGQKNGVSFPIISYAHDGESENLLDMVKTEYYWSYQLSKYIQGNVENIPGKKIEEQQLQKLFVSGEKAFEEFLDGIWYKLEARNQYKLVLIEPGEKIVNFFQNDIQEVYRWSASYKTRLPHVLYINAKNELVPFINIFINVEVLSVNSIAISISEGEFTVKTGNQWDGTYFKLTGISPESFRSVGAVSPPTESLRLSGNYTIPGGADYTFADPFFTIREKDAVLHGGYALSLINVPVLEMKVLDDTGLVSETRIYGVRIDKNEVSGKERLILQPGYITISGFQPNSEPSITLEPAMEESAETGA